MEIMSASGSSGCEATFTRRLSYGQIKGTKRLLLVLIQLRAIRSIDGIMFSLREHGDAGQPSLYSVRVRYHNHHVKTDI